MITIINLNIGPHKKWAGMGKNSIFCNKTFFEKIYVTLSIKMNVSPLHMNHFAVLSPHEYGHIWKRTPAWTLNPKGSLKDFTRFANKLTRVSTVLLWASFLYSILSCQVERNKKNQIFRPIMCHKLFKTQDYPLKDTEKGYTTWNINFFVKPINWKFQRREWYENLPPLSLCKINH